MPSPDKDTEHLEPSFIAGGNANDTATTLETQFGIFLRSQVCTYSMTQLSRS